MGTESARAEEMRRLARFLRAELVSRMHNLECAQVELYEARHERDLLHRALQDVEALCVAPDHTAGHDELVGDVLAIVREVPSDFRPVASKPPRTA